MLSARYASCSICTPACNHMIFLSVSILVFSRHMTPVYISRLVPSGTKCQRVKKAVFTLWIDAMHGDGCAAIAKLAHSANV
jgi:hypothetical protein